MTQEPRDGILSMLTSIPLPWFVLRGGQGFSLRSRYQNGFFRSATALTDCHCSLPDRWSCGKSETGGGATAAQVPTDFANLLKPVCF